ncbi:hypothetical protein EDD21DRAFT_85718 [Dissophora ornata]|nr:hypothetical protein EDD21DRAFT_85718 [Dissophora ornata]
MNGEHPHPGRDLPLPGNGNGHVNTGPASGSPGYMSEERQPHIPGINSGGPRPPTPAGAMPQMMSGDRMQGPPQMPPSSGPGHNRPSRGRAQSPAPEGPGPYARSGSPGMTHTSNGHGQDPHYPPQHPYGHGPPPSHTMMHGGHPQAYEAQDQGTRTKQEQPPQYQHHRQRSGDLSRPGPMDESHGAPHPQRHHLSDPHAHAPSPPRDDRRVAPTGSGYSQQSQPGQHNTDERWAPASGPHGRHPSDDQGRDTGRPQPGGDRGQGLPRNPSAPESFPGRNDMAQAPPHGLDPERREQRPVEHRGSPSFSRSSVERGMKEPRTQSGSYDDQLQQSRGRDYEASGGFSDQGRGPSNWTVQEGRPSGHRSEDQDQDEIAASLVSLSGKGSSRSASHRPQDDDYDMEEPEPEQASALDEEMSAKHSHEQQQRQHQHPDHLQYQQHQHQRQPSPLESHHHDDRDHIQTSRPPSHSKQQLEHQLEQPPREQQAEERRNEGEDEDTSARAGSPLQSSQALPVASTTHARATSPRDMGHQGGAATTLSDASQPPDLSASRGTSADAEPSEDKDTEATHRQVSTGDGTSINAPTSQPASTPEVSGFSPDVPTGAAESAGESTVSAGATENPERIASAPLAAEDEDTEMEEGEVREDEDEVMSSGAVPTTTHAMEPSKEEGSSK